MEPWNQNPQLGFFNTAKNRSKRQGRLPLIGQIDSTCPVARSYHPLQVNRFSKGFYRILVFKDCTVSINRYVQIGGPRLLEVRYALQVVRVGQPEEVHWGDRHSFPRTEEH